MASRVLRLRVPSRRLYLRAARVRCRRSNPALTRLLRPKFDPRACRDAQRVLRINPSAKTACLVGPRFQEEGKTGRLWLSPALGADGAIYGAPGQNATHVLRVDPTTLTEETRVETLYFGPDLGVTHGSKYTTVVPTPEGLVFAMGPSATRVLRITPDTEGVECPGPIRAVIGTDGFIPSSSMSRSVVSSLPSWPS